MTDNDDPDAGARRPDLLAGKGELDRAAPTAPVGLRRTDAQDAPRGQATDGVSGCRSTSVDVVGHHDERRCRRPYAITEGSFGVV